MKRILFLSIVPYLLFSQSLDIKKGIIQLGVFKNEKNIIKIKNIFKDYNLFIKTYPDQLKKIFIIDIEKDHLSDTLKKVKKYIPSAFIVKSNKKNLIFSKNKQTNWLEKSLNTSSDIQKLDSKAIIKTRKKFFQ